jgi:hypothetical protein
VVALVCTLVLGGCASLRPAAAPEPAYLADRLYLGGAIPGGGSVSEAEWARFVDEVVTPRFPDGLTLWRAEGRWRDGHGASVREPVRVLEIVHPAAESDAALEAIAREYRRRFRQEAVLRVTAPVRMWVIR